MDEELAQVLTAICDRMDQIQSRYDTTDKKIEAVESKISVIDDMVHSLQKELDEQIMAPAHEYMDKYDREEFSNKIREKIAPYMDDMQMLNGDIDIPGQLYDEYDGMTTEEGQEKPDRLTWANEQLDGIFSRLEAYKKKLAEKKGVDPKDAVLEVTVPASGSPKVELETQEEEKKEINSPEELEEYEKKLANIKI